MVLYSLDWTLSDLRRSSSWLWHTAKHTSCPGMFMGIMDLPRMERALMSLERVRPVFPVPDSPASL